MQMSDNESQQFTQRDVKIISKTTIFDGFFKMVKYRIKHRLFAGGWSGEFERELFVRGPAAALLPYDPVRDEVVLVEQFRVGCLNDENPWQLEIVAGIIDTDESAEEVVRREAMEEAGVKVEMVEPVTSYFPSAGGCDEKLFVFAGKVDATSASGIHGLDYEDEDIRVHVMPRTKAYDLIAQGKIENGASIIALQWLELHHQELKTRWTDEQ
ncbi:ADP-ribose diphosphatase [Vibrio sp. SCSIO 43136]|uniref:ADP-ribose diphosphatase n=1 Tax=Vibrio sp. SCSIO 43136 TaxID=2819101 RepID=UPI00207659F3|nr:ADP-ribose diphosphatase [Vibrio sp. SCSIO 43136]USD66713.1 ADP-ribose diphosphatase [Vibrio sp. SCSIO 43136]